MFATVSLQHLALVAVLKGQIDRSARLRGYVDGQYGAQGMQREITERWGYERLMAALREKLRDAEIERLAAEGATWSEDLAADEALQI